MPLQFKIGLFLALVVSSALSHAAVFKVGEPVEQHGMSVQMLYIQAVTMSHEGGGAEAAAAQAGEQDQSAMQGHDGHGGHAGHGGGDADIHLEAAVEATENNPWGFKQGHWIPYLNIYYRVAKVGGFFKKEGQLIPMAANTGPHYGANLKLDGPGKYVVTYFIEPPRAYEFPYHTDKETGVHGWWDKFEIKDEFIFLGVGKKGGY